MDGLIGALRGETVTVGLIVENGVVTDCAPYVRRLGLVGRPAGEAWRRLQRDGWRVAWIPDHQNPS